MGALIALVPAISGLIPVLERVFSKKGTGSDRMAALIQALQAIAAHGAATGVPGFDKDALPSAEALRGAIESELARLKELGGGTVPVETGGLYLVTGKVIKLPAAL